MPPASAALKLISSPMSLDDTWHGVVMEKAGLCIYCSTPTTWGVPNARCYACPRCQTVLSLRYPIAMQGLINVLAHLCAMCGKHSICGKCTLSPRANACGEAELRSLGSGSSYFFCNKCLSSPEEVVRMIIRLPGDPVPECGKCNRCRKEVV